MTDRNTEFDQKKNQSSNEESEPSFLEWAKNKIRDTSSHLHDCMVGYNNILQSKQDVRKIFEEYQKTSEDEVISSQVLPHLRGKSGDILLQELVRQWDRYKCLHNRLLGLVNSLMNTNHIIFYTLVYRETKDQVRHALECQIDQEQNGEKIDEAIIKKVVEMYDEMARVLNKRSSDNHFYSRKASQ